MKRLVVSYLLTFFLYNYCQSQCFTIGADLSYTNSVLAKGGVYRDSNGNITDPYALFAQKGANMVRIRLWHTPENKIDKCGNPISTNNLDDVVLAFKRAKTNGMKLNLSIHYGDYFNDPGTQKMPKAWMGLSQSVLLDSIYNYTYSVLNRLKTEGVTPDIVAIGNETTNGFIDETTSTNGWAWPFDADKFNIALTSVDNFNKANGTSIKKAVHFTDNTADWLSGLFYAKNVRNFDIIGISFYPHFSNFTSLQQLGSLISKLKINYKKEIMIFETGAPWTDTAYADSYGNFMGTNGNFSYPLSPQGQRNFLFDLANTVYNAGGTGILYWEPAWVTSRMCDFWGQGSGYENVSFFDFQNGNRPLPAFDIFNFCNSLSVENRSANDNILIFPNPANDKIKIIGIQQDVAIKITDVLGRTVKNTFSKNNSIDISNLPDGTYTISLFVDNKVTLKKFIKR
jgi:arabinogalactan endo-1,4-beta-galactosidase